jgi:hypothetical protein
MSVHDEAVVRRALAERRSADAIVGQGVGIVRAIAARPEARGTIGKEVSSTVLPVARPAGLSAGDFPMYGGFHPMGASHQWHGVNQVISLPAIQLAIRDPSFGPEDTSSAPPVAVQKVGRNKPCPCGSGKKYKKCHGA